MKYAEIRHHFFCQCSINRWNSLSQEAVDAPSINSFKNHLEKLRKRQTDFFMDWCPPSPMAAWLVRRTIFIIFISK